MDTMQSSVFLIIIGVAVAIAHHLPRNTWPDGTYGLPMPNSGCPRGTGFPWHQGTRYHDNEDSSSENNQWSSPYDLAGNVNKDDMEQKFCMKTLYHGEDSQPWPKGEYCILKKGDCPAGFNSGYIRWDDENGGNANNLKGQHPDGQYDANTIIYYCCRSDGHATNAIVLPDNSPFVLLKSSSTHLCQYVKGKSVRSEYFQWDCEDSSPSNYYGGSIPRSTIGSNIKIEYCYYY